MERRSLIYLPTIHSEYDIKPIGPQTPEMNLRNQILQIWKMMGEIMHLNTQRYFSTLPDSIVRNLIVFSEGVLPGRENAYLSSLQDHPLKDQAAILYFLTQREAKLKGIDDPVVDQKLRSINDELQAAGRQKDVAKIRKLQQKLSTSLDQYRERRDGYAARTIAESLPPGGAGTLLIGAKHKVKRFLPPDIDVFVPSLLFDGLTREQFQTYGLWKHFEGFFDQLR